jgi:hypothetical protein
VQEPACLFVIDVGDVLVEEELRCGMVVRVDGVGDLAADAVGSGDLVDGPRDVMADRGRRVEQHDAVRSSSTTPSDGVRNAD